MNEIKGRETYRPFAPVVREKDLLKYFDINDAYRGHGAPMRVSTRHHLMQFAVPIRSRYLPMFVEALDSATGKGRVQTVVASSYLHDVLDRLEALYGMTPVLINTSLNVKGKPIANTLEDIDELVANHPEVEVFHTKRRRSLWMDN